MDFLFYDVRLDFASNLAADNKHGMLSSTEMNLSQLNDAIRKRESKPEELRELQIELHKKLTIPFSCILFAVIGMPLAIRAHRSVRSRGFTIGIFLVLIYYLLRISGEAMVETGRLPAIIGTWAPNLIFAVAGFLVFVFTAREGIRSRPTRSV
jgi:lipopolysaccharide export system permease protein